MPASTRPFEHRRVGLEGGWRDLVASVEIEVLTLPAPGQHDEPAVVARDRHRVADDAVLAGRPTRPDAGQARRGGGRERRIEGGARGARQGGCEVGVGVEQPAAETVDDQDDDTPQACR
jgi:hypothetical protein